MKIYVYQSIRHRKASLKSRRICETFREGREVKSVQKGRQNGEKTSQAKKHSV